VVFPYDPRWGGYVLNCPKSEHTRVVSHATGRLAAAQATKCFVNFLSFAPSFGEWSRFQARSTLTRTSEASPGGLRLLRGAGEVASYEGSL